VPDLLEQKHREIIDRLKELVPHVEEHRRLEAAIKALDGIGRSTAATVAKSAHKPGEALSTAKSVSADPIKRSARQKKAAIQAAVHDAIPSTGKRRAGLRTGSGARATQALAHIKEQPGVTIAELAARMGIKSNYLYRVLPALEKQRKVHKRGKGWHPRSR
jgi:hypothetical protein